MPNETPDQEAIINRVVPQRDLHGLDGWGVFWGTGHFSSVITNGNYDKTNGHFFVPNNGSGVIPMVGDTIHLYGGVSRAGIVRRGLAINGRMVFYQDAAAYTLWVARHRNSPPRTEDEERAIMMEVYEYR